MPAITAAVIMLGIFLTLKFAPLSVTIRHEHIIPQPTTSVLLPDQESLDKEAEKEQQPTMDDVVKQINDFVLGGDFDGGNQSGTTGRY